MSRTVEQLRFVVQLWRYFGPSWLAYRLAYSAKARTGLLRRCTPTYDWSARPLKSWLKEQVPSEPAAYAVWRQENGGRFFFQELPSGLHSTVEPKVVVSKADAVLDGHWPYFDSAVHPVGFPPPWHASPESRQAVTAREHWSRISDFGDSDIKLIWEPSRFSVAYLLVRAYALTGDERYPEAFWELIEDWMAHNPPNRGPNWKCGQETSFRIMAWCFSLYGFSPSQHTTPSRIALISTAIAAQAERVAANITYARSQKNNHAISEGVGLWSVGVLFPEFREAEYWRETGRQVIEEEVRRQIYNDGSYIQHSLNYHRVMLHDLLWAFRLGELNDLRFSKEAYERFSNAVNFLYQLTDVETGQVPNYGANDGARVLPLSACDYSDFRPVLQAGHYLAHHSHLFPSGLWDEDLLWLFGSEAVEHPSTPTPQPGDFSADEGGYYTLRDQLSWAMIRCADYRDRPSHADQLHVDLWWRGENIACDAGTYSYNAPHPWNNALAATAVHNTVTVDQRDQMTRAGRFLWLDWANGTSKHHGRSKNGHLAYFEGEHDGYQRLSKARHCRGVLRIGAETWAVVDKLQGQIEHQFRLHWLFADYPYNWSEDDGHLELETQHGPFHVKVLPISEHGELSLVREDPTSVRGWRSHYYAHKEPALSLALDYSGRAALFATVFCPEPIQLDLSRRQLGIRGHDWTLDVQIDNAVQKSIVCSARLSGSIEDFLEI